MPLNIKLIRVGHIPVELDKKKLIGWKSELFTIDGQIENYTLNKKSDGPYWQYSDQLLEEVIPTFKNQNFVLSLLNVPLQNNFYSRKLSSNRVCLTLHEISDILHNHNIPIENFLLRMAYAYSVIYKRYDNRLPSQSEETNYAHDITRGCLFDMNGIKSDIIHSCNNPVLCDECKSVLRENKLSHEFINSVDKEIGKIKKDLVYRVLDFINSRPVLSIFITIIFTLGMSILGAYLYDLFK